MKRYYNQTTDEWYVEGTAMTRRISESEVFSGVPTVEQLTAWGFSAWIDPVPTPSQLLERAKSDKIEELEYYDSSSAVNEFFLGGQAMWLTREERTQIDESIAAYEGMGATQMTKYFGGIPYTFPLTVWKQMLNALIVYASEALNVTETHKVAINALETIEAVNEYDFTTGYPAKPHFGE